MRARRDHIRIAFALLVTAAVACGCFNRKKKIPRSDPIPPSTQVALDTPLVTTVEDRPVKIGALPMLYLMEHPGQVRIVDATAGRVIYTARVGGRTIVSLDAETGVSIGGRRVLAPQLDPAARYEIYLSDPTAENVNRNVYQRR